MEKISSTSQEVESEGRERGEIRLRGAMEKKITSMSLWATKKYGLWSRFGVCMNAIAH